MKSLAIFIAALAFATATHALEFIDTISERKFFDGALTIKTENKDDFIFYRISNSKNGGGGNSEKTIESANGWFLAAESPAKVWIYDGRQILRLFEFTQNGMKFSDSAVLPDLVKQAPTEVIERINSKK